MSGTTEETTNQGSSPDPSEWVDCMPGTWIATYRPVRFPPIWPVVFPTTLLDIYGDRLVFRPRNQFKRFFPFAVLPLDSIEGVSRSRIVPRVVRIHEKRDGANPGLLFRGDPQYWNADWMQEEGRSAGAVRTITLDSRRARIDWLVRFFGDHGIVVDGPR